MTTTHELIVFKAKQGIRRVEELGMENDFYTIVHTVEEITATNPGGEKEREKLNYVQ